MKTEWNGVIKRNGVTAYGVIVPRSIAPNGFIEYVLHHLVGIGTGSGLCKCANGGIRYRYSSLRNKKTIPLFVELKK